MSKNIMISSILKKFKISSSQYTWGSANLESGFTLSVALIMTTIILAVSFSITTIITKSVKISGLATEGAAAYMSAEVGVDCVRNLEDATISIQRSIGATTTGLFISPTTKLAILNSAQVTNTQTTTANSPTTVASTVTSSGDETRKLTATNIDGVKVTDFNCGSKPITTQTSTTATDNAGYTEINGNAYSVTKFSINGVDSDRCSDMEVYKSDDGSMIIISRGYSKCAGVDRVVRELRVTIN